VPTHKEHARLSVMFATSLLVTGLIFVSKALAGGYCGVVQDPITSCFSAPLTSYDALSTTLCACRSHLSHPNSVASLFRLVRACVQVELQARPRLPIVVVNHSLHALMDSTVVASPLSRSKDSQLDSDLVKLLARS
jgi:hypothetical protein